MYASCTKKNNARYIRQLQYCRQLVREYWIITESAIHSPVDFPILLRGSHAPVTINSLSWLMTGWSTWLVHPVNNMTMLSNGYFHVHIWFCAVFDEKPVCMCAHRTEQMQREHDWIERWITVVYYECWWHIKVGWSGEGRRYRGKTLKFKNAIRTRWGGSTWHGAWFRKHIKRVM